MTAAYLWEGAATAVCVSADQNNIVNEVRGCSFEFDWSECQVQIIDDDFFDSNLEFELLLEDARNCVIEPASARSTIMIMDDDLFPANELEEELKKEDEAGLYTIGWQVLWSFMKFSYGHVREIRWKTIVVLLLSMLGNAYYLGTIFIRVYLVDTVLNTRDEESSSRLLIPGDRNGTAVALALAWILPNFILLGSDYFEMAVLEMGFNIRLLPASELVQKVPPLHAAVASSCAHTGPQDQHDGRYPRASLPGLPNCFRTVGHAGENCVHCVLHAAEAP